MAEQVRYVPLPFEILGEIFSSACGWDGVSSEPSANPFLESNRMLLCLTEVCRQWHAAAIAEQSLWTHIYLAPDERERAAMFLQRSGHAPLDIAHANFTHSGNRPPRVAFQADITTLLLESINRVRSLRTKT